jgi:hypothetical protein
MMRLASLVTVALVAVGCASPPEPDLLYTGTMHVTWRTTMGGAPTGSIFGLITIPSELVPTSSAGGCDYVGSHQAAGVTMGSLTVSGFGNPVVVEPEEFIDGMLYLANFSATPAADTVVTATVAGNEATEPVIVDATIPALVTASLPPTISRAAGATVTWPAGNGDEIVITIEVTGLGVEETLSCRTTDSGSFTLTPAALAQLVVHPLDDALLSISRRHVGKTASTLADLMLNLSVESEAFATLQLAP